jgi:succinate dehydrogenase / fumarate reductase flavoprotein subunit
MQSDVGIFRDEAGLKAAVEHLEDLARRAANVRAASAGPAYNPGWHLCRDLQNMLTVSRAVARAALLRHESRGAHSRLDFPAYDEYWGEHNVVVSKDGDNVRLEPRPVPKAADLLALVEQRKEAERT